MTVAHDATMGPRPAGGGSGWARAGSTAAADPLTVYVAGSEEQAGFLREFTAQLNALRASYGQQAARTEVLVLDADDRDQDVRAAAATYYLGIVGGLPGTRTFDLRTP